ncbi:DUF1499 domain-containing protein [Vibrio paucivorans]
MTRLSIIATFLFALTACSQNSVNIPDRTNEPCGDKPNCVSTQDKRTDFNIARYQLADNANLNAIEQVALTLPGAESATVQGNYLRIECTSTVLRFVDDLELKISGSQLIVRSESRVGYSDFGVNRERTELLRQKLKDNGLIE